MPSKLASELLDFDMDRYLNPWLPHNRVDRLPMPVSRFLGHRKGPYKEPPALVQWFSAFIGAFVGILCIGAIFKYAPGVSDKNPPVLIASLGATAILDYSAIRSPVAQPRNAVFGQGLSAIVGVAIAKCFLMNPNFNDLQWVAGAVACACAALVMCMTNTVHPPGGATAVIATTQANVIAMGWWYPPIVILGAVVMLLVALLWNNVLRQYPVFWWTPSEVGSKLSQPKEKDEEKDEEKKSDRQDSDDSGR
jgi:CBS-domain-containing membrane protein